VRFLLECSYERTFGDSRPVAEMQQFLKDKLPEADRLEGMRRLNRVIVHLIETYGTSPGEDDGADRDEMEDNNDNNSSNATTVLCIGGISF
jgi:hypothetical protein